MANPHSGPSPNLPWVLENERRVEFMNHMYNCSGREDPKHPMHRLFTGLWQEFCINEAGRIVRDQYFEMKEAIRQYEAGLLQPVEQ